MFIQCALEIDETHIEHCGHSKNLQFEWHPLFALAKMSIYLASEATAAGAYSTECFSFSLIAYFSPVNMTVGMFSLVSLCSGSVPRARNSDIEFRLDCVHFHYDHNNNVNFSVSHKKIAESCFFIGRKPI